jgi:hypothetical protein
MPCAKGRNVELHGRAKHQVSVGRGMHRDAAKPPLQIDVADCGEPGSTTAGGTDMFRIQTFDYMAGGPLIGGNIQIKQ